MAVSKFLSPDGTLGLFGLSTDAKPTTGVPQGSVFRETDTGRSYQFVGAGWVSLAQPPRHQPVSFAMAAVPAGLSAAMTSSKLSVLGMTITQKEWVSMRPGSLTGLSAHLSLVAAGADLIVKVYKNDADTNFSLTILQSNKRAQVVQLSGVATYGADDRIDVRAITGVLWTALTSDLLVHLEVSE